jgi:heat shock protein HtpX
MNTLKTFVLMSLMTILFIFIGSLIGGNSGIIIAFGFAIIMNFSSYWFSDKIVLMTYRAKQIENQDDPELFSIIEDLTNRANLPMPKVYIIPTDSPNAFATGRNPEHAAVAVTMGIRKILDRDELEGVIAHELSHIKNRDILIGTIAATFVGALTMVAHIASYSLIFFGGRDRDDDGGGLGSIFLLILAPIAATLIQLAISRSREYMADEGSAIMSGKPLALANALQKLERGVKVIPIDAKPSSSHLFIMNPLSGGSVMRLFSTHPPVKERIERLRKMR